MSDRIEQICQRLAAITPGPWSNTHIYDGEEVITGPQTKWEPNYVATARMASDAEFISAAPDDVDYLLREVRRLETELWLARIEIYFPELQQLREKQRQMGVTVAVDQLKQLRIDHESADCGEIVSEEEDK